MWWSWMTTMKEACWGFDVIPVDKDWKKQKEKKLGKCKWIHNVQTEV